MKRVQGKLMPCEGSMHFNAFKWRSELASIVLVLAERRIGAKRTERANAEARVLGEAEAKHVEVAEIAIIIQEHSQGRKGCYEIRYLVDTWATGSDVLAVHFATGQAAGWRQKRAK